MPLELILFLCISASTHCQVSVSNKGAHSQQRPAFCTADVGGRSLTLGTRTDSCHALGFVYQCGRQMEPPPSETTWTRTVQAARRHVGHTHIHTHTTHHHHTHTTHLSPHSSCRAPAGHHSTFHARHTPNVQRATTELRSDERDASDVRPFLSASTKTQKASSHTPWVHLEEMWLALLLDCLEQGTQTKTPSQVTSLVRCMKASAAHNGMSAPPLHSLNST